MERSNLTASSRYRGYILQFRKETESERAGEKVDETILAISGGHVGSAS